MNGKRKIYFIVECIAILIGVLSFLGALPIKKLSYYGFWQSFAELF